MKRHPSKYSHLGTVIILMLASTTGVFAHTGHGDSSSLSSGFWHPLTGLDHIIAMIAVGLWGAQLGKPLLWGLPVCFPVMMAAGAILGITGVPLPAVELLIALSGIVLGLSVLLSWHAPQWGAILLVGLFAIFHGYAHGAELPESNDALLYALGFVVATGLLHLFGIGVGSLSKWKPQGPYLVRTGGGIIMLTGCYFLAQAVG